MTSSPIWLAALVCCSCGRDSPTPAATSTTSSAGAPPAASLPAAPDPWATTKPPAPPLDRATVAKMSTTDPSGSNTPLDARLTKVTLLAFWEPACKPCMMELPQLSKLAAELHDPNLSVLAVDVDADPDRAAVVALLADRHIALPVVFDPEGTLFATVFGGIMAVPGTAIVAADGIETERGYEPRSDAAFVKAWKQRLESHAK